MANDYAALKARIATEIKRSDQSANIIFAIGRAIEHYASKRFWFNIARKTGVTVADDEYVTVPTGLRQADNIFITIGGQQSELRRRPLNEIEQLNGSLQLQGQPTDYADIGSQIRLYPIPGEAYDMAWLGLVDLGSLTLDADSNAWTDTAQDLIAAHAAGYIYSRILEDPEAAAACAVQEQQAWNRLQRDSALRQGDGVVEPW